MSNEQPPRLPLLRPGELDVVQEAVYRAITEGPRAQGPQAFPLTDAQGALHGPFNAMLHSPAVGTALQGLGSLLRYRTDLTPRVREMVILAVAAHHRSSFERWAHEAVGRTVGLSEVELAALWSGDAPDLQDPEEAVVVTATLLILRDRALAHTDYRRLRERLDHRQVVDLVTMIGYYELLALQLSVFAVNAPGER